MSEANFQELLKQTFKALDTDNSGALDKAEFRKFADLIGEQIPAHEMDKLFDAVDKELGDGNGTLDYNEFSKLIVTLFSE